MTSTSTHSVPSLVQVDQFRNVTDLLLERYRTKPDHISFEKRLSGQPVDSEWVQVTTREFYNEVIGVAKGLMALGVEHSDRVAIMAPSQYGWAVADLAAMFAGAVVVPIYDTSSAAQIESIFKDSQPVAAFAGGETELRALKQAFEAVQLTPLAIVALSDTPKSVDPTGLGLDALARLGSDIDDTDLEFRRTISDLDQVATIVYTSGTTGSPKGALITHKNLVGQVLNIAASFSNVVTETGNTIIFVPLAHVLGRALQLICIANGMRVAHLSDPKEVVSALPVLTPTFLVVVPRVLEKIEQAAANSAREKKLGAVWNVARKTAIEWGRVREAQDSDKNFTPALGLRVKHWFFDRLFYRRLRSVMGGKIENLLSGAATLRPDINLFFHGIGVPVLEGYGLTETTAPFTANQPGQIVAGTVGTVVPGNSIRIAENGEILAAGLGVFSGYNDPTHNAAAFVDGFFRTGDLGSIDEDGRLTLLGRLNDLVVTSTGKTVSPETWERTLEANEVVAHATVVGNDRPYLTAVIMLDEEYAQKHSAEFEIDQPVAQKPWLKGFQILTGGAILDQIREEVSNANSLVSRAESVRKFLVIATDPVINQVLLTPTMKLKRAVLLDKLKLPVDELYQQI